MDEGAVTTVEIEQPWTTDTREALAQESYALMRAGYLVGALPDWDKAAADIREGHRLLANDLLACLARLGVLVSPRAEIVDQWAATCTKDDLEEDAWIGGADARGRAVEAAAASATWEVPGSPGDVFHRRVITVVEQDWAATAEAATGPWVANLAARGLTESDVEPVLDTIG